MSETQESMSSSSSSSSSAPTVEADSAADVGGEKEPVDAATRLALEKQRKADLLRSQEVFMKRSTGIHQCSNCGWEYSPEKGDSFLIGGMIKPGVAFEDLPSNWRCPTCRSSKDGFKEVVETIPGFEVNQGYGFGTNSMTTGQKNALIWGGIGGFFLLFIGGYALS
jgi:rubredoxin